MLLLLLALLIVEESCGVQLRLESLFARVFFFFLFDRFQVNLMVVRVYVT